MCTPTEGSNPIGAPVHPNPDCTEDTEGCCTTDGGGANANGGGIAAWERRFDALSAAASRR